MHFSIVLLVLGLLHFFYFISSTTYHPLGAFHRLGTIFLALAGAPHMIYVFVLYQANHYPNMKKMGKIILYTFYGVLISVVFIFFIHVLSVDRLYHFSGHYWDFDADSISKQIGVLIFLQFSIALVFGMWSIYRVYKRTKKMDYFYLMILLLFSGITIPPGIINVLSRDGLLLREAYQIIVVTTSVTGIFFISTLYINISNEKTKIIHRIIGITFATFLLLVQFLAQNMIEKKNISYDKLKRSEMKLHLTSKEKLSDLKYFGYFSFKTNQYHSMLSSKNNSHISSKNNILEWKNSMVRHSLNNLREENHKNFSSALSQLINKTHPEFLPYKNMLLDMLSKNKNMTNAKGMLGIIDSHKLRIGYIRKKLAKIPESDFHKKAPAFLKIKGRKELIPFIEVIQSLVANQSNKKLTILSYLRPFVSPAERKYRGETNYKISHDIPEHFVSFNYVDEKSDRLYEAGFSYLSYRKSLDSVAFSFVITILFFLGVAFFGFGLFFSNALISPIQKLAQGFREINAGNLSYRVDVYVEDEIGFLTRSFNQMGKSLEVAKKQLQEYAESLERKVEERTVELNSTLTKVVNLKNQQDGDYFLTYLLTHPLSRNQVTSKKFEVDSLLRQRKRFSFRKYISKDLGGDINITNQIELHQKKYIAFLNADGMGKSMQGAVGALVCGSVFSSIIDRTQNMTLFKKQYPEKWLKATFIELHRTFKSFLGNMLVSSVIGLIEENTGMVYYINAEHPRVALYRASKALFVNKQKGVLGKLGTLDIEEDVHIRTFRMMANDTIIFGSDGKDEIVLGKSEDGNRVINEDQNFFLEAIEKSEANLKKMFKIICRHGRIIDDISLIKIKYIGSDETPDRFFAKDAELKKLLTNVEARFKKGDTQGAENLLNKIQEFNQNDRVPSKKLMVFMAKLKKYEVALEEAERYFEYQPDDIQVLYSMAYIAKKLNKISYAIDLAERFHLRVLHNVKNLIQLAELYVIQKNYKKVKNILEMIEDLEPHRPEVKKIKSLLTSVGMLP